MIHGRIQHYIGQIHLIYLGCLPALATFVILTTYGYFSPALLFVGGIIVVSVYLAVIASYTTSSARSIGLALLILLDGPVIAAVSQSAAIAQSGTLSTFAFAIDAFLIDGLAIWSAIVWLAATTDRPTSGQRTATIVLTIIAISIVLSVCWPYLQANIFGHPLRAVWLVIGIGEAILARYYLLEADEVQQDEVTSAGYIIIFLLIWLVAMIVGNIIYETS